MKTTSLHLSLHVCSAVNDLQAVWLLVLFLVHVCIVRAVHAIIVDLNSKLVFVSREGYTTKWLVSSQGIGVNTLLGARRKILPQ